MTALAPLPQTVPPLLARLGSDSDGERMAVLRQVDRVLRRAGWTWTDLSRRIGGEATAQIAQFEPPADGPVLRHWRIACQWIISNPDWRPTDREEAFVRDMRRYTKRRNPTPKQAAWIRSIVERLGGRVDA